jgi:hypothetical protein
MVFVDMIFFLGRMFCVMVDFASVDSTTLRTSTRGTDIVAAFLCGRIAGDADERATPTRARGRRQHVAASERARYGVAAFNHAAFLYVSGTE